MTLARLQQGATPPRTSCSQYRACSWNCTSICRCALVKRARSREQRPGDRLVSVFWSRQMERSAPPSATTLPAALCLSSVVAPRGCLRPTPVAVWNQSFVVHFATKNCGLSRQARDNLSLTKLVVAGALASGLQGYGVRSREIAPLPEVTAGVAAGAGHLELVVLLDVRARTMADTHRAHIILQDQMR